MQQHHIQPASARAKTSTRLSPLLYAMERLEQLEPETIGGARRTMQDYALAYVEHYQGDVPNLEREREFLVAALAQAWQREAFAPVMRLTDGLACIAGRLGSAALGQQLLLWGIEAARLLRDRQALARFLTRFAALLWSRGQYEQAQQTWIESQEIARAPANHACACLWEPLGNLVCMADLIYSLGDNTEIERFAALLLNSERCDPACRASAHFIRAFHTRITSELDKAYTDLNDCLSALAAQKNCLPPSSYQPYVEAAVQTEFVRLRGDDDGSRIQAMKTASLARAVCDPFVVAELLIDQAMYACYRGTLQAELPLLVQLNTLSRVIEAPHVRGVYLYFQQRLSAQAHAQLTSLLDASPTPENRSRLLSLSAQPGLPLYCEQLSRRELEVVQLAARGCTNHEIADSLIIAVQTVKKHLEHIYNKLDVHNRTQMVAVARVLQLL
jgi:ATP/maltotriose-dependent transcriptional regulator MalT